MFGSPNRALRRIEGADSFDEKQSIVSYVYLGIAIFYLGIAIFTEVIATSALKASEGFTRPGATIVTTLNYAAAFYFLSLALKTIPMGIAYAIWSGMGIVLISVIGLLLFRQSLDLPAVLGLALIVAGVAVIRLYSEAMPR